MKFIADLHLHSKYSRAVSQEMILPKMAQWAKLKGIQVIGTGDFTHPFWFDKLKNELEDASNGLYRLKSNRNPSTSSGSNLSEVNGQLSNVFFLLTCEIASIYSQGGKNRRIHNLFFFPNLSSVEKFSKELIKRGANLRSDGRPIVGIPSDNLTEIALSCDDKALVIPAHAWTPWFSVFGSFSGFDSIEECFGDMSQYIYAIETGLSSDPAMNWRIADLDQRSILSFSDAHSLPKMGREATVFEGDEVSYDCIYDATRLSALGSQLSDKSQSVSQLTGQLKTGKLNSENRKQKTDNRVAFTIEFFPEEGKYHLTGHRDCNISQTVQQTKTNGSICPNCHKSLTIGVMHRVEDLAAKDATFEIKNAGGVNWVYDKDSKRPPYVKLVPLVEILSEVYESNSPSKKVLDQYIKLVEILGSELAVLLKSDLAEIARINDKVAQAIAKVRTGDIYVDPGYDGKYGIVKIWSQNKTEPKVQESQLNLFA